MVISLISWKQPLSTQGTSYPPWKKSTRELENTWRLLREDKVHYDRRVPGDEIKVGDRAYLHVPVIKSGQKKKLHSPWHGPHVVVKKISDVTHRIEEVDNRRKRRVVRFNRLKLCGEPRPKDQQPNQPTGQPSSSPLRRPHLPPRYVSDETDLMFADETAADGNETHAEVPAPEPVAEVVPPPVVNRPRREVHAPALMRLCFLIFEWTLINFLTVARRELIFVIVAVHPVISILLKNPVVFLFFVAWHGGMPFSKGG